MTTPESDPNLESFKAPSLPGDLESKLAYDNELVGQRAAAGEEVSALETKIAAISRQYKEPLNAAKAHCEQLADERLHNLLEISERATEMFQSGDLSSWAAVYLDGLVGLGGKARYEIRQGERGSLELARSRLETFRALEPGAKALITRYHLNESADGTMRPVNVNLIDGGVLESVPDLELTDSGSLGYILTFEGLDGQPRSKRYSYGSLDGLLITDAEQIDKFIDIWCQSAASWSLHGTWSALSGLFLAKSLRFDSPNVDTLIRQKLQAIEAEIDPSFAKAEELSLLPLIRQLDEAAYDRIVGSWASSLNVLRYPRSLNELALADAKSRLPIDPSNYMPYDLLSEEMVVDSIARFAALRRANLAETEG